MSSADFLIFVLQLIQLVVNAAIGKQLLVGTHFADLSLMHDDDLVRALDGREAVRDDERGASFDHAAEGVANPKFGFRIDAGGGLIEDQNPGVVGQRTRK